MLAVATDKGMHVENRGARVMQRPASHALLLVLLAVVPAVAWMGPAALAAESLAEKEAREAFESLFGRELQQVTATGGVSDDLALAGRMIEAAEKVPDAPILFGLLVDKAFALSRRHTEGYPTAIRAMELLAAHVPARAAEAHDHIIEIRRSRFDTGPTSQRLENGGALVAALEDQAARKEKAGDLAGTLAIWREAAAVAKAVQDARAEEFQRRADVIQDRLAIQRRIRDVEALLERDPTNTAAREGLIRLYVIRMDDPASAVKHLAGIEDADLKKYVPAAAKPLDEVPELACLELGEWYRTLAGRAPPHCRPAMWLRAHRYLARFLAMHPATDIYRTRGQMGMEKVTESLATAGIQPPAETASEPPPTGPTPAEPGPAEPAVAQPTVPTPPEAVQVAETTTMPQPGPGAKWVDVLDVVEPTEDARSGTWDRAGGALALGEPSEAACLVTPMSPRGSYILRARFARQTAEGDVCFVLPVGERAAVVALGAKQCRLGCLDRKPLAESTACGACDLAPGTRHDLEVGVQVMAQAAIVHVAVDGRLRFAWRGPLSSLSMPPVFQVPTTDCLGFAGRGAGCVFERCRLHMLTGRAVVYQRVAQREGTALPMNQWIDLLHLIDPAQDAVQGSWQRQPHGLLIGERQDGNRIMVPLTISGSYELELKFVRTAHDQALGVVLPVGSAAVALTFSRNRGEVHGLDMLNKHGPAKNRTGYRPGKLVNGQEYAVKVRVEPLGEKAHIVAWLDDDQLFDWTGRMEAMVPPPKWRMPFAGAPGLVCQNVPAFFPMFRLRMTSGEARFLRGGDAPAEAGDATGEAGDSAGEAGAAPGDGAPGGADATGTNAPGTTSPGEPGG